MARFLLRNSTQSQRKCRILILALIWCVGLISGVGSFYFTGDSFPSLMRMAAASHVSIVNLVIPSMLPFLFSAFALYLQCPQLLAVLCFLKAWLFGFVSFGCISAFGTAGWLLWLMALFSDIVCMVPLWWFWISHVECEGFVRFGQLATCILIVLCVISLDQGFISPFLVDLIEI